MSPEPDHASTSPEPQQRQGDGTPARPRPPWKVEGARGEQTKPAAAGGVRRPPGGRMFWLFVLALLTVNWVIALSVPKGGHPRLTVPYSYFRAQAQAGDVAEVNSQGETIDFSFRHAVRYPAGKTGKVTHLFKTERPAFADDQLLNLLLSKNVK